MDDKSRRCPAPYRAGQRRRAWSRRAARHHRQGRQITTFGEWVGVGEGMIGRLWLRDVDSGAERSPVPCSGRITTCRSRACPSCPKTDCYLPFSIHSQKSRIGAPIFADLHVMSSTLTAVHAQHVSGHPCSDDGHVSTQLRRMSMVWREIRL